MSRPNRVRMLLTLAFVLTLVAGVVAGIGFASVKSANVDPPPTTPKPPVVQPTTSSSDRNWLADQLGLNPGQRDLVSAIWKEAPHEEIKKLDARRRSLFAEQREAISAIYTSEQRAERERLNHEYDVKVADLRQKRDEAISALYSAEQKAKKDQLNKEFAAKFAETSKEREKLLQPMIEKTRQVLNDEQRKRFDMMMRAGPGGPGFSPDRNSHRGQTGRPGGTGPSTRPGSQPSDWPRRDFGPPRSPDGVHPDVSRPEGLPRVEPGMPRGESPFGPRRDAPPRGENGPDRDKGLPPATSKPIE